MIHANLDTPKGDGDGIGFLRIEHALELFFIFSLLQLLCIRSYWSRENQWVSLNIVRFELPRTAMEYLTHILYIYIYIQWVKKCFPNYRPLISLSPIYLGRRSQFALLQNALLALQSARSPQSLLHATRPRMCRRPITVMGEGNDKRWQERILLRCWRNKCIDMHGSSFAYIKHCHTYIYNYLYEHTLMGGMTTQFTRRVFILGLYFFFGTSPAGNC